MGKRLMSGLAHVFDAFAANLSRSAAPLQPVPA